MTKEVRMYNGEKTIFSINGAAKLEKNENFKIKTKRMKLEHYLIPHTQK